MVQPNIHEIKRKSLHADWVTLTNDPVITHALHMWVMAPDGMVQMAVVPRTTACFTYSVQEQFKGSLSLSFISV